VTPKQFAKLALSLPEAVESAHMGHPDFRVKGKIFASLGAPDDQWAMVKLSPEQQASFVATDAAAFQPCNGAWGRGGCTNVRLKSAPRELVRAAQQLAYENIAGPATDSNSKSQRATRGKSNRGPRQTKP